MPFKGKRKTTPKEPVPKPPKQEFSSEEEDNVFSNDEEEDEDDERAFDQEDDLLSDLAEDDDDDEDEEDEDDDEEDEEAGGEVRWGKKSSFFQQDEDKEDKKKKKKKSGKGGAESSSEEEEDDDELEESEATRLLRKRQAGLKREFLQIGGGGDSDDDDDEASSSQVVIKKKKANKKDNAASTLQQEAPEVDALLKEFAQKAKEVRQSVQPALERLQSQDEANSRTSEGVAYLETRTHLLLSYLTSVCFYLVFRAENGSAQAESHPVVSHLVKLRVLLDKLRPLDNKLKTEIDELVRRAALQIHREEQQQQDGDSDGEEEGASSWQAAAEGGRKKKFDFRPDLAELNNAAGEDGDEGMLSGSDGSEEEDEATLRAKQKARKQLLRRAEKSRFVQELLQEQRADEPEEIVSEGKQLLSKEDEARVRYEEENYTRLPENKRDRKRKAELQRKSATHGGLLSTLEQELDEQEYAKFRDLLGEGGNSGSIAFDDMDSEEDEDRSRKSKGALAMHLNEMSQARKDSRSSKTAAHRGGDDDTESRPASKKQQQQREHTHQQPLGFHNRDEEEEDRSRDREVDLNDEDDYYQQAVKRRRATTADKHEQYDFPKRFAPEPVKLVEMGQSRFATKEMIKNRGLTAHKSKDAKNPRSHLRNKYEAKVKARRGQVRELRKGEADAYQGERSGIRSNLVRSRQAGKL